MKSQLKHLWRICFLALILILTGLPSAWAQKATFDTSDLGTITVIGDSLADGIWSGIYRSTDRKHRKNIKRYAKISAGLARNDFYDWKNRIEGILRDTDVVVFSVGLNDFVSMYIRGSKRKPYWSKEWQRLYVERVEYLMKRLAKEDDIITVWVGLPIIRPRDLSKHTARINRIFEKAARDTGIAYLPLYNLTQDKHGEFNLYGQALDGRIHRLRANDGVHFTGNGYDLLAHHIMKRINRKRANTTENRVVGSQIHAISETSSSQHHCTSWDCFVRSD